MRDIYLSRSTIVSKEFKGRKMQREKEERREIPTKDPCPSYYLQHATIPTLLPPWSATIFGFLSSHGSYNRTYIAGYKYIHYLLYT